ncbi:MAG TPA: hypothetical protein VFM55_18930 [Micromonosporaceae bacterium]|nr:hypothetical protein [Micromonosporaceae bacterium]
MAILTSREELAARGVPEAPAAPDAAAPTSEVAGDRVEDARRWLYRHRRDVAAPVVVALALVVLRQVVHVASGWSYWSLGLVAFPMLAVAAGGVWWLRQVDPRGVSHKTRMAAAATVIAALLWLASPARLPLPFWPHHVTLVPELSLAWFDGWLDVLPGWPLTYPLLIAWTAAAVWLRHRRFRVRPVAVVPVDDSPMAIWTEEIGCEKGAIPASYLVDFERLNANSWSADVVCVRGQHGTDEVRAATKKIAGVYGINPDWIEVQGQDDYSRPRLIVTERATLATSRPWRPGGFDVATGRAEIATYPDGSRARFQLYVPGQGIRHFWVTAGTGGGKTGAVNALLGQIMQHGVVVLDLVDLGETSLPAWVDKSFRFGRSRQDGLMALRRAEAVMDARKAAMCDMTRVERDGSVVTGISTLEPSSEWPVYLVLLEEWPEMLGVPEAVAIADRIGRQGRKYCVELGVVTQGANLDAAFKGAEGLRKNIQQGNVIALRADRDAGTMAFGGALKVNLGAIPLGMPGLGYVLSAANMRDVTSRIDWVDDDPNRPAGVPSSWEVAKHAVPGTPNPVDLAAIERVEHAAAKQRQRDAEAKEKGLKSAQGTLAQGGDVTREAVLAALREAQDENDGMPVALAAVAKKLAPEGLDDLALHRHTDTVRKHLKTLAEDPTSGVTRPKHGEYAA